MNASCSPGPFGAWRGGAAPAPMMAALLSVVLLAACADANMGGMLTPAAAPAPPAEPAPAASVPAAPSSAPSSAPSPAPRAASAGRASQGPPQAPPQASPSLTPEEINAECWMVAESNRKVRDIDQRLKLVDKCVQERTKAR